MSAKQMRENNSNWKGGKHINNNGYVKIYIGNKKYQYEHILVMEKHLGRKLKKGETVHHKDETFVGRSKNDINNLQLLKSQADHVRLHLKGKSCSSKGKGKGYCVSFDNLVGRWVVKIHNKIEGKWHRCGKYKTKEEAFSIVTQKLGVLMRY